MNATLAVGSDTVSLRATSDLTAGALLAVEVTMPAGGGPPVLHRHAAAEVYRVEAGELAIYVEDDAGSVRRHAATPGAVVPIPGGREHTVRNESDAEARAYVVFAPGTEMEGFLRAAAAAAGDGPPSMERVLAIAERHGVELTRPVPEDVEHAEPAGELRPR